MTVNNIECDYMDYALYGCWVSPLHKNPCVFEIRTDWLEGNIIKTLEAMIKYEKETYKDCYFEIRERYIKNENVIKETVIRRTNKL